MSSRALRIVVAVASVALVGASAARAGAPGPTSVIVAGSFQSELGCPGDWQPDCALTHLDFDASAGNWQGAFAPPAGSYQSKVAIDDNWDVQYPWTTSLSRSRRQPP